MPMYFPDLESVKRTAEIMAKHEGDKQYKGVIPTTDEELPRARKELGNYLRTIWNDNIAALEIELALTKENYEEKLAANMMTAFFGR